MSRRAAIILVFLILVWGGPWALGLITDWLWFADLGFESVYRIRLLTQGTLFLVGGVAALALLLGNVFLAQRLSHRALGQVELPGHAQMRAMEPTFSLAVIGGGLFFALTMAGSLAARWSDVLRFFRPTAFGATDPLFGRDIAFFVFTLPVYRFVQGWLLMAVVLALLAAGAVYAFRLVLPQLPPAGEDGTEMMRPRLSFTLDLSRPMRAHLFGLGAVFFALLVWGYRLNVYELVYSAAGAAFGAGYADVHARLPAQWFLMALSLLSALLLLLAVPRGGFRLPAAAGGLWIAAAIVVGGIYPAIVQRLIVQPQELERERPYLERSIRMTRQAFALDRIQEVPVAGEETITSEEIAQNPGTIGNIRLWDPEPLLTTYNQIQSIRAYYEFVGVDVDRYTIDGEYRQVMLSARELAPERLPSQAQTWVNRRLQFTHGYGAAMSAVNEVTPEGLPTLFVQDVPPRGKVPIDRPELYFSEKSADDVIVR
ncbi:MAG: UPF0182 family protein, partial [Armatimonadetes bacterium]|nr:UPF0182 family protein [Armatimonadota bacterium]